MSIISIFKNEKNLTTNVFQKGKMICLRAGLRDFEMSLLPFDDDLLPILGELEKG
jgi:hypothetical protein